MASEKKFVHNALENYILIEHLEKMLDKAGVSSISVQRTPIATRVTVSVQKPGMVVGKRGAGINELVEEIKGRFGIENPQIEVLEVPVPSLDAKIMAQKIGKQVEQRGNIKQVMRMALQDIMGAGALGSEIRVAGKIVGKGGKARTITQRKGYLKKSGESSKIVLIGKYTVYMKAGAIGVTVRILPPGAVLTEKIRVADLKLPVAEAAQVQKSFEPKAETGENTGKEGEKPPGEEEKAEKPGEEKLKKRVYRKKQPQTSEAPQKQTGEKALEVAGKSAGTAAEKPAQEVPAQVAPQPAPQPEPSAA